MAFKSQVTITRPANVTPYSAGDVVGGAFPFTGISSSIEKHLLLTSCGLRINASAIPAGMTSFRLNLYSDNPPSALGDNAAWDLPAGDRAFYLGYVDLGSPADVGASLFAQVDQVSKHIQLPSGGALYGYLVTNGAFTPAAASEEYVPFVHAADL